MHIPEADEYFLNVPLYRKYKFELPGDLDALIAIFEETKIIDCYCVDCKRESTFTKDDVVGRTILKEIKDNYLDLSPYLRGRMDSLIDDELYIVNSIFRCSRDNKHVLGFFTSFQNMSIQKLGQYPSIADLEKHKVNKYRKILPEEKYQELAKGIGLSSHGIGIGSFVYLRRIFEYLIEEAHKQASKDMTDWNEPLFIQSKIKEKIKMLDKYLPDFLVENREIYSILSKGIHELSEEECLEIHPDILLGIELILDEKLYEFEKMGKIKRTQQKIKSIASKLK